MLTICSSCGLLTSSSQHRSGCKVATTESTGRVVSMSELSNITETSLFTTSSNEHTLFAGTLRDWCDPLLQGQAPVPVPLCPRCATCKCESLKVLPNSSVNRNRHYHHHHRHHEPSCPIFRQQERSKTASKQRLINKPKRRANSYDPSVRLDNHRLLIKEQTEHSSHALSIKQRTSSSRIPVRKSVTRPKLSSSTVTTTASEYSSISSTREIRSSNMKTRIPRPIEKQNASFTAIFTDTNQPLSTSDDEDLQDYDPDSLNDNVYQTASALPMSHEQFSNDDILSKKKKKNIMMLYYTSYTTNQLDNTDEQILMKETKKKQTTMSSSSEKSTPSGSSSESRFRRFWHREGRHSKSKAKGTSSTSYIDDLSSTTSSSSTSSLSNRCSSSMQSRNKSRAYKLASPSQSKKLPSLSDDSLSEKGIQTFRRRRPHSAFISHETPQRPPRFESTPPPASSVYLIEVKNNNRQVNSFGLTKTITYVWKNNQQNKRDEDLNTFPKYSVEQVPPILDQNKRKIPISSRHVTLQRGKTDCWQNLQSPPDSILTSSCHNHTGSASNLLSPALETKSREARHRARSNGRVISVTTTKRQQPSLLNQSQNTEWNIEGDGKQVRYSNLKWYSADQLKKDDQSLAKHRIKRRQQPQLRQISDSTTESGSSSDQHNRSAPPILQRRVSIHTNNEVHEVFQSTSMNKQNDIPDYSSFHREINDTSSPVNHDEEQPSTSSASSREIRHFETIVNDYSSSSPKQKINSYESTDEDVDELNMDYSEDIDPSTATVQTYRDKLNARLHSETSHFRPRILSTEYSQITLDSGVDIVSEQKISQPKIDEQYSEETTNQNDLFALSDDSLLDIELPQSHDVLQKPSNINNEQSLSLTDESDDLKSYLTAITDSPKVTKTDRGTSENYYSAESEFNSSVTFQHNDLYNSYELETISDEEMERNTVEPDDRDDSTETSPPPTPPRFDFKLPSFGDWIDQVFTTFLAETNQHSRSTSRSSSMLSIHASQNTIDTTSSSQVLTVIENTKNNTIRSKPSLVSEENNQLNSSHRRSQSWPNNEQQQQQDEQNFKDMSSSSLNNKNIDFKSYTIETTNGKTNTIDDQEEYKISPSLVLSSMENGDEEVINKETMQSNYHHQSRHPSKTSPTNTDQIASDDEKYSFTNIMNNNNVDKVEETEHDDDEKYIENEIDNKPLLQVQPPDDSSYEEFHHREHQHTNSHESLRQSDHRTVHNINTTASSTDDLSTTRQLLTSVFHSKDSALGLSDDNLNCVQTNQFIIMDDDDDEDDDDDDDDLHQQTSMSLPIQHDRTVDNNHEIQDTANNNHKNDKNEMTCEHINDNRNSQINNSTMLCINDSINFLPSPYTMDHTERTTSSSSSEQLIPKEKQTGMYYPAFGSSAAIHLAEKYNCEWLQDITSPTSTVRKCSTIVENENSSDSRIFRQHQSIGDDDEFYLSLQTLQPSHSCPHINYTFHREPLRERSYSLTTLDAYARLDITRDTLEQMWLSLLDLAFSDKDDIELGEYKLRHIMSLSNSYTNINTNLIEKSRSHGDIFSTANKNQKLTTKKSKSFDVTSLQKSSTDDSANVGLLQGAAISEPFVDRIGPTSIHSDTDVNLIDIDKDSIQSYEQDSFTGDEQYSPVNQDTSPVVKEPLNYVFHYPYQTDNNDEYEIEPEDDITYYLPETTLTTNQLFGEEDKQLYLALGFDDDEATAAFAAAIVQPRDIQAILRVYRPHSLSTIPSSRASQSPTSLVDSDDILDIGEPLRKSTISGDLDEDEISQSDHSNSENDDNDKGEIESNLSSPPSRPLSPIQSRTQTPPVPEPSHPIKLSSFANIDHDAWERSISEPIYTEDLAVQHNSEQDPYTFSDNLITIIPAEPFLQSQSLLTIDQIERSISSNVVNSHQFTERINEAPLIDFTSQDDYTETMNVQQENKSTNSTRTSMSSIHDTQLDPNELAYRLARLDNLHISSPPKKTLADELAELGEQQQHRFDSDSLDRFLPTVQEHESVQSTPHTYGTTPPLPVHIDQLTSIVNDIREINQQKAISSLRTIIEDIHSQNNNQFLTKIFDYHHSPPVSNLRTIVTELQQSPIGKSILRPQRPTHLELDTEEILDEAEDDDEHIPSPLLIEDIPIPSNLISGLEQQLSSYKAKSPSPSPSPVSLPMARRISELPVQSTRYHTQRIEKVSDLEIVKQGKGFKIGYVDRQGTDQRVILTKRIEAGPDIMARDPHVRLPYKGRKILNQVHNSILYTNGYNSIQEDKKYERTSDDIEVPIIGTNPQHFDESDMISIDIDGPSTMLNSICESIVITQGSVYTNSIPQPPAAEKPLIQPVTKNHHEEYLLDSSHTPTPSHKKEKVEIIDTWQDRTVIDGSSTTWRSTPLQSHKATKHVQSSNTAESFVNSYEPSTVQMRLAPSHDVKYRTSEQIEIPSVFDWNEESINTPIKQAKTTRDIALSPIIVEKHFQTSSTSPIETRTKVDRSCQYSPLSRHDLASQCHFENLSSATQVSTYEIPNFLVTQGGTQTTNESMPILDDSGIQTHIRTISPALSAVSSDNQQTSTQPFTLSGTDFIRKLNEQREHASALTVTQYTDGNFYLPQNDNNQLAVNNRQTTLERSADSGILMDDQSLRNRRSKANFSLQVDIKGSSSDSEDLSEATERSINRIKPSTNGDAYEHRSELVITTRNSANDHKRFGHSIISPAKEIEQQILQLRRERAHILELLSLNWSRSNIWVELTEAKLNYIIGETDALLRSLSFDATPTDSERVKLKMHQYEEDMAELTRQRLAIYRERLEDSKKQIDMKIDELELKKSTIGHNTSHYSTLEYTPRVNNNRRSKSYLSTSAENLSNMPVHDSISTHPHLLDVSFLTSTPSNQNHGLPPRYPRSQQQDTYRTIHRPTPRYPSTMTLSNENRYDYPRYRSTSYVTPSSNLSGMQGLSKSQQAILDETDKLVKDSQDFHNESASQFERARETLLSSETPIRLARANMAASRRSPSSNYLPNDVTLAELFKYEQSLAKETAKNTRLYASISTTAES